MVEPKLTDDLLDALAVCEYRHPGSAPLTLFCATQAQDDKELLAVVVADTLKPVATKIDGPIVRTARACMISAGYRFEWTQGGDILGFVEVRSEQLSNHRRSAALKRFRHIIDPDLR